jgi:hypothetical protein
MIVDFGFLKERVRICRSVTSKSTIGIHQSSINPQASCLPSAMILILGQHKADG